MQSSASEKRPSLRQLLLLVAPSFKRYRLRISLGLMALIIVDILQLLIPRILKQGIDSISTKAETTNLAQLAIFIICIACTVIILRFCWRYMILGFSRILECTIRNSIFSHILQMDATFFEKNSTGKLMAHSSNDLSAVQMAFGMGTVAAVDSSVMLTVAIAFMLSINVKLTILALVPLPLLAISTKILAGQLHTRFETVQEQFSHLTEFSRSAISSIWLVKAYTMEDLQTNQFDALGKEYVRANLKVGVINGLLQPLSTLVGNLGILSIFFFGGRMVIQEVISLGDFVAFITYLYMLIWPMMAIGWVTNLAQRGLTSLQRIRLLMEQKSMMLDGPEKASRETKGARIELCDLSFTYPNASQPALHHINLTFLEKTYGLTGRTGCGKTSLCRILCRLYPVEDGMYLHNEIDVNRQGLNELREQISYVSQESTLFSDTVKNNIRFGNEEASEEEITEAARRADIHNNISELSNGYDTLIGEQGVKLSGGQRQRIALARALLTKRPILLIDDGLSAVDVETEHQIFSRLREGENKTIIIISNRIKLLSMTDEIIILDSGEIADRGSHQHLLRHNSLYQSMAKKQQEQREEKL
ncbi:ABC transporter ATP-binding protein [Desulfotalea psychrophila]|uniref:Related to ABC transporter, multidrug resistance-like ATP-binding protein (MdlA) n=1 Tax=Desulfotalea psychrophila (strain LSv54 / DSM 12343) TaxID=177439 RepID=Q6AS66_DESPS|nr:ABC transporter ATP-binding protein [Desulfotalea psychrophila]CAG34809.1 related to ABC transporter, multidrug resistance-like ATP-binding protein (MdlA) [Desulfotalea psychrophila LSv54]